MPGGAAPRPRGARSAQPVRELAGAVRRGVVDHEQAPVAGRVASSCAAGRPDDRLEVLGLVVGREEEPQRGCIAKTIRVTRRDATSSARAIRPLASCDPWRRRRTQHRCTILVLADRDWTHHDTGGNGANLYAQISRWVDWGNEVTVVAGDYPGAQRVERFGPRLIVHRMGTRSTVFPRAILAVLRGIGRDADVVLEVINGITFLTPLWLRKPRVAMVHHVHRELFLEEFPRTGPLLFWLLERLPLRLLYRRTPFLTISNSARDDLVREGIPRGEHHGRVPGRRPRGSSGRATRSPEPRLIFVGRLKAYKNVEALLDVLEAVPGRDPRRRGRGRPPPRPRGRDRAARARRAACACTATSTRRRKAELYGRAWVN